MGAAFDGEPMIPLLVFIVGAALAGYAILTPGDQILPTILGGAAFGGSIPFLIEAWMDWLERRRWRP